MDVLAALDSLVKSSLGGSQRKQYFSTKQQYKKESLIMAGVLRTKCAFQHVLVRTPPSDLGKIRLSNLGS